MKPKAALKLNQHPYIPHALFAKVLRVWNFFESFWDEIYGPEFSKEELFISLSYSADDKPIYLVTDIHVALIKLFLEEFHN